MKIIIAGGRTFNNYNLIFEKCEEAFSQQTEIEVVSGIAKGADALGELYSKEKGYKLTQFAPDWNKYGKGAGYKRNEQMALYADALIAFWDGESRGTKSMIELAEKHKLKIKIIRI